MFRNFARKFLLKLLMEILSGFFLWIIARNSWGGGEGVNGWLDSSYNCLGSCWLGLIKAVLCLTTKEARLLSQAERKGGGLSVFSGVMSYCCQVPARYSGIVNRKTRRSTTRFDLTIFRNWGHYACSWGLYAHLIPKNQLIGQM